MGYRYLALHGEAVLSENCRESVRIREAIRSLQLRNVSSGAGFSLFVAESTPVTHLPGGQVVVGHLFPSAGSETADCSPVESADFACTRRRLVSQCWGEYLLFQPSADGPMSCAVMRDPSGGVPCFYSTANGRAAFVTSDVSLALAIGIMSRRINWDFVTQCLIYSGMRNGKTGLMGLEELLPGQSMVIRGRQTTKNEEWSPFTHLSSENRFADIIEAAPNIRETVQHTVRTWAEADESVLMELSGGLDSSIVAVCLQGANARVVCSTVSTPVPGGDERMYSEQVARTLDVPLQSRTLGYATARFDLSPPSSAVLPCMGPLQYAVDEIMVETASAHGVRSHFSGAGGDTVFGSRGNASPIVDAFKEKGFRPALSTIHDVATIHQCTVWKAVRLALRKMSAPDSMYAKPDRSFLELPDDEYTPEPHPWSSPPCEAFPGDRERVMDLAGTQIFRDDAPRGGDRWVRMPLLSQPVVEACLRVPTWMQTQGGQNRAVARQAFRDLIPADVYNRRSKGTFVAYLGAVYQREKAEIGTYLSEGRLQEAGLLDIPALSRYMGSQAPSRDRLFIRVLELCMIESWLRAQD